MSAGGCVYRMKGSKFYWIKCTDANGKTHYESSKSERKRDARGKLRKWLAEIDSGTFAPAPR
jgi:hypothetical protein